MEVVLGVLAKINELTISKYWVAPVASDKGPERVIVNVVLATEQVFESVTFEYEIEQVTVVPENLI